MFKKLWLLIIILFLFSCKKDYTNILGYWEVKNNFYKAKYQVFEDNKKLKVKVIYSNDGTSKYKFNAKEPRYVFTNLKQKEKMLYIDGVSGATKKTTTTNNIKVISNDSLIVTTYLTKKPIITYWTKINN